MIRSAKYPYSCTGYFSCIALCVLLLLFCFVFLFVCLFVCFISFFTFHVLTVSVKFFSVLTEKEELKLQRYLILTNFRDFRDLKKVAKFNTRKQKIARKFKQAKFNTILKKQ